MRPPSRPGQRALLALLAGLGLVVGLGPLVGSSAAMAQSQRPWPSSDELPAPAADTSVGQPSTSWPTGDELRRSLQEIGFTFRVDGESGDWLGWAPRASIVEAPAMSLSGAGGDDAVVGLSFQLLETELLGTDVDAALTALLEVAARVPMDPADIDQVRRFVTGDLLENAPETLAACFALERDIGSVHIGIDAETGDAEVRLGPSMEGLGLEAADVDECEPIHPSDDGPAPGDPTSERVTIAMSGDPPRFDPAETELTGSLVTVVLTFRNDSSTEQSLTFEGPLEHDTGPVAPGEVKLIVVRQLEPGDYRFGSIGEPSASGAIRIVAPDA